MKTLFLLVCICPLFTMLYAQQPDEQQVKAFLLDKHPTIPSPENIRFFQCKYKRAKTWQYIIACSNTTNVKHTITLLFAEKLHDSLYVFEPFIFPSVETFEHINIDNSRDHIDELFITSTKDSGNVAVKYTGIYSCKNGRLDTLIKFYSFQVRTLKPPYFVFHPGMVVEQEDLCQLTDLNGDGRMDISNRIHRKICNKAEGTDNYTFDQETDYAEYKYAKGRFVKMKATTQSLPDAE